MSLVKDDGYKDIWVSIGKEREGNLSLLEGQSLTAYYEKLTHSDKYDSPILSLLEDEKKIRYLMFAPTDLERKMLLVEEEAGKGVMVKITYIGKEKLTNKEGRPITLHRFDVEYDTSVRINLEQNNS